MTRLALLSAVAISISGTPVTLAQEAGERVDEEVGRAREAIAKLREMQKGVPFQIFDTEKLEGRLEDAQRKFHEAVARIKILPGADEAGSFFARSDFAGARRACEQELAHAATDPYCHFLAGICCFELHDYSGGATHFAQVTKSEPASHVSRLMEQVCGRLASKSAPVTDDAMMQAYADVAIHMLAELPADEARDLFLSMFPFGDDPLLARITAETLENRGPFYVDPVDVLSVDDTPQVRRALYLILRQDSDPRELRELLKLPAADPEVMAADFMNDFFSLGTEDKANDPEYRHRLAELVGAEPDQGFWRLARIEPLEESDVGNEIEYTPLTVQELRNLKAAAAARKYDLPMTRFRFAAGQVFERLRFPFPVIDRSEYTGGSFQRRIYYRAIASIARAGRDGDLAGAEHIGRAMLDIAERNMSGASVIDVLIGSSMQMGVANALAQLPGAAPSRQLHCLRIAYFAQRNQTIPSLTARLFTLAGEGFPIPTIERILKRAMSDRRLEPWEAEFIARGERDATGYDGLFDINRRYVRSANAIEINLKGLTRFVPAMRARLAWPMSDDARYACMRVIAELDQERSIPFLLDELSNPCAWARLCSAELLEELTGESGVAPNVADWRAAVARAGISSTN